MLTRAGFLRGSMLALAGTLIGCGGSAPPPAPVNPYATGGNTSVSPPAPPSTPGPATGQAVPSTATNPFGGPAPGTVTNPFGAPTGEPVAAATPAARPEKTAPAEESVAAAKPTTPKPVVPSQPAVAVTKPIVESPKPDKLMPKEPAVAPGDETPTAGGGTDGVAKASAKPATKVPPDSPAEPAPGDTPVDAPKDAGDEKSAGPAEKSEWSLALDPAPAGSFAPAGTKLGLRMPSIGTVGPDFVESTRQRVLFPATPGPFVALGLNDDKKQFREVWNLIDKKKLGQVRNLEFGGSKGQALSPDGKHLAGKPQWDSVISVFSVTQNKPLSPIKLQGTSSKLVAFAGKTRLIFEDNKELHIYSVPDLKPKAVVSLGTWKVDDGWALSPGGRYFAAVTKQGAAAGLSIFDLDSGEQTAAIPMAKEPECLGAAFSTDGKQLAVILGGDAPSLRMWTVETGRTSGQFDLTEHADKISPRENYQGGRLEWFPDHRHLLLGGKAVYDSRNGKLISEVSKQPIYPVRVVCPDQLAVAIDGQLMANDLSALLKASSTPAENVAGTPEPTTPVPVSKPVDRTAVAQVSLEDVDWNVKTGKPPAPIKATGRGVEIPQGQIYIGCLSQSPQGIGFVMYTSAALGLSDDGLPTAEPGTRVWLEPLDLKNGVKQKSIPLPQLSVLMSVSQDGTLVCTQNIDGLDRLDIWATRDGSSKGSLTPYHDAAAGPDQRVNSAEFLDAYHILTSGGGRLTLWDIAENKALYEVEIGELRPELSPARDYIAVCDGGQRMVYLLEAKTGKPAGTVTLSDLAGDLASACAFHPEGRYFAALTQRIDGGELRIVDLTDGEIKKQVPLPVSGKVLQWVGSDFLLIDGSILVCVSRECVVWNYSLPVGMHLRDSPDQRHWYIAADPARSNVYSVRGVDMPDENVVQRIGALTDLRGKRLLQPGQSIALDIEIADPEGETGFADKVKNILTDRYLSARIKVSPGVPVTMKVRDNSDSGWSLSLVYDGKPIWTHELDGMEGPSALLGFEPPKHAFPAGSTRGAGKSVLGVRGVQ